MRPVGTGVAGRRALVGVMTIGTVDAARGREGRDQAGDDGILSGGFDRMIGGVGGIELDALVGLRNLAFDAGRATRDAVPVATETEFIFIDERIDDGAGGIDAFDTSERAGSQGSGGGSGLGGVRIVAISAFDVASRIDRVFGGIMDSGGAENGVAAAFVELSIKIFLRYASRMT